MLTLYAHPFASYCWKAIIALHENGTPFRLHTIDLGDPASAAELERLWPFKKFPVLVDGDTSVIESTIIIEYLDLHHPGPARLVSEDAKAALEVRFMDRFFDNYIQAPMQAIVFDTLRGGTGDSAEVKDARGTLETAYAWLDRHMGNREWAAGDGFSLADCSAAPAFFYADWVHPIGPAFPNVRVFRTRLNARPSVMHAIEGARPFRHFFPLGAPDRD